MTGIVTKGSASSHGGTVITGCANTTADGVVISRVNDLHSCPLLGHGTTIITNGSTTVKVEGQFVAQKGISVAACGAIITGGATDVIG